MRIEIRQPLSDKQHMAYVNLLHSITAASPIASIINALDGHISADIAEPVVKPHSDGLILSLSGIDSKSIGPGTLVVWTVSASIPYQMLPESVRLGGHSGYLYASLHCSVLEPFAQDLYLARKVAVESNLPHKTHSHLKQIVELPSQCQDPAGQIPAGVFLAWQAFSDCAH